MPKTHITLARLIAVAAVTASLPVAAAAQGRTGSFSLKGNPQNPPGCVEFDSRFVRDHTVTLQDGKATVKAAGGINANMTLVRPDIYRTTLALGRLNVTVVANLAATPKTLTVTDAEQGCTWSGLRE